MCFRTLIFVVAMTLIPGLAGAEQRLIIVDQHGLEPAVQGAFQRELSLLIGHRALRFHWAPDGPTAPGEIRLSIQPGTLRERPEALGVARLDNGKVAPDLAIFPEAIAARLANPESATMLGRALARVASHEVIHFLDQSPGHHSTGLMREVFSSDELASDDSTPFRQVSMGR